MHSFRVKIGNLCSRTTIARAYLICKNILIEIMTFGCVLEHAAIDTVASTR